ncbi:helix-turn-helix transcriptional regulator [Cupriavidus agavae]|uniref:AraC family transcriptional regulator n=1 Tax=Cupriavidus agavae TaxID=1001822 RepID=A0A4Q7S3L2_9BURK|nr:AraC family transcriptional regulator [Cupriavidus agavae]RZT39412.1 AraC family transcriptional regulator [Cupriavidus agavae]
MDSIFVPPEQCHDWHLPDLPPSLSLSGGALRFAAPANTTETVGPGLKLVVVLSGKLTYKLRDQREVSVSGPAWHLSLTGEPFTVRHRFGAGQALEYVAVRMPQQALERDFGVDAGWLAARLRCPADRHGVQADQRADRTLQALGRQMLLCPMQGSARRLFLAGKALELTATVIANLEAEHRRTPAAPGVRELRQLQAARDELLASLENPPTLPALARSSGLNVAKLTEGFRQLYGGSVYEFVRAQRLERAYRLLAAGDTSVAAAAQACGYTDSHFTKVFRRQFGVNPRALR